MLVRVIYDMYMYSDIRSGMRVNGQYSEELWVGSSVYQGTAQPPVFHSRAGSSVTPVPYWYAMGASVYRSRDLKSS